MSCLIIKNDGIGDLILASGLIRSVGELFEGKVDLVTCGGNREIADGIEPLRRRFYCSRDNIRFSAQTAEKSFSPFRIFNKVRLDPSVPPEDKLMLRAMAKQKYEIVICLRRFIRQSALVMMLRVRGRKKYCAWQFPMNASWDIAKFSTRGWNHCEGAMNLRSELSYNKNFLEGVFNTTIDSQPQLSFCHKQTVRSSTRKIALGLSGGSTNWPYGYWIELGMRLSVAGWKLILLGGKDIADLGGVIASRVPNSENRIGQLSWRKTAEVLCNCEGYIGNDTGLSHFASLILEKCLIILGGGTFRRFFRWPGAKNQYLIFHGLDCFDCAWECKFQDRFCLSLVQPRNVEKYFSEVMNGEAKSECDLNTDNETYQLAWRKGKNSDLISVRLN